MEEANKPQCWIAHPDTKHGHPIMYFPCLKLLLLVTLHHNLSTLLRSQMVFLALPPTTILVAHKTRQLILPWKFSDFCAQTDPLSVPWNVSQIPNLSPL